MLWWNEGVEFCGFVVLGRVGLGGIVLRGRVKVYCSALAKEYLPIVSIVVPFFG